ncbi:MAG: 3-dehydroquinate synthase [Flavisolibacter sp.]|jgi:3-dehydroquinate synthase|nr:3-dehydroquinate synthase [Flavisolibacter sp.]
MNKKYFRFSQATVAYYPAESFQSLKHIADQRTTVLLTDENVFSAHTKKFRNWNTIILKPGEAYKNQAAVDSIIEELIGLKCDRNFTLVGVGGGVVTDITGYVAGIYMRGIRFGFVPTSLLAMVDASIGGKNGVDVGVYKNMAGLIRQPSFILHDLNFLASLPDAEWYNGFAEIIKHASVKDAAMFKELEQSSPALFMKNKKLAGELIQKNVRLKHKVVMKDEFETGERKLLNFGHTLGHAIENLYALSHGRSIAIGMSFAAKLSENLLGFKQRERVEALLEKYQLPVQLDYEKGKVLEVLTMDKKRSGTTINFILIKKTGQGIIHPISLNQLAEEL